MLYSKELLFRILFPAASILGIFTAFIFGLTSYFGPSARVLIDTAFISGAGLSLVIVLVGSAAIIRIATIVAISFNARDSAGNYLMSGVSQFIDGVSSVASSHRQVFFATMGAILVFLTLFAFAVVLKTFLDFKHAWIFLFTLIILISVCGLSVCLFNETIRRERKLDSFINYLTVSFSFTAYVNLKGLLAVNVAGALVLSVFLGQLRFLSLANSLPVCISIIGGERHGAIIGQTENGIFWVPGPVKFFEIDFYDLPRVNYIERASLIGIDSYCIGKLSQP